MRPAVYLNGEFVPEGQAKISIWDMGFMYSAVFMEAARTFQHGVYRLADHLERMDQGMRYAGLPPLVSKKEMGRVVLDTLAANIDQFSEDDDCWMCWQVRKPISTRCRSVEGDWPGAAAVSAPGRPCPGAETALSPDPCNHGWLQGRNALAFSDSCRRGRLLELFHFQMSSTISAQRRRLSASQWV